MTFVRFTFLSFSEINGLSYDALLSVVQMKLLPKTKHFFDMDKVIQHEWNSTPDSNAQKVLLGPFGMHGISNLLSEICPIVESFPFNGTTLDLTEQLEKLARTLLTLLKWFRERVPRCLWDPVSGFRELLVTYERHKDCMQVRESLVTF